MRARLPSWAAIAFACSMAMACNLVAGLGDFVPADTTGTTSGTGAVGGGGAGNASTSETSASSGEGGGCADHLLVNELRVEGGDFVELFNPTPQAISLDGFEIRARTMGGNVSTKWAAPSGESVPSQGYYVVADGSAIVPRDATLDSGIDADGDPIAVALIGGGLLVDSVCVCSPSVDCAFEIDQEICSGRALVSLPFHTAGNMLTAGRTSCVDTDEDGSDFKLGCATAKEENFVCP